MNSTTLFLIEYDSGLDPVTGETIGAGQACYRTEFAPSKADLTLKPGETVIADVSDWTREDFRAFGL